jgi:hypothetical protein
VRSKCAVYTWCYLMSFDNPAILLFAAIAPIGLWLAVMYWRCALFSVFVLLVFEGALRKWAFPGAQAQIYLVKDAILLAVYLGFVLDGRRHQPALRGVASIRIVLLLAFAFGCVGVFNPNSPSVLVGFTGLKTYFLYAPIAFILPYAFKSREHLLHMIRLYLVMAIPVALLGFIQVAAGPDSFLNTYVSHTEDPAVLAHFGHESIVRTSGTFSYISGYTSFLSFLAFLAIGYNLVNGWSIKKPITPILVLTLVIGAMFTTGSRAPIYTLVATGPVILWLAASGRLLPIRTAVRLCLLIPIVAFVALHLSPKAFEAFAERATESSDSTVDRLLSAVDQTVEALSGAPALGVGIGATHPSALTIMGTEWPWWLGDLLTEDEVARVTVELGALGLLLVFGLRFLITAFALRWALSFKDPAYRALGIALAVYLAVSSIFGSITLNVTSGLYYWGALGLLLAMLRFEQSSCTQVRAMLVPGRTKLKPVSSGS